jgi:hypothetical protein
MTRSCVLQVPDVGKIVSSVVASVLDNPLTGVLVAAILVIGLSLLAWVVLQGLRLLTDTAADGVKKTEQPITVRILGKLMSIEVGGEHRAEPTVAPPRSTGLWLVPTDTPQQTDSGIEQGATRGPRRRGSRD